MNLGALAPFIIDVDVDSTMAIIHAECHNMPRYANE